MTAKLGGLALIAAVVATASAVAAPDAAGPLPGARTIKACAAAGPFWPTMTLALRGTAAWVACKEQSRVVRIDTRTGKTQKSVRLDGAAIAVVSGFSSIWALDSTGTLYRVNPASAKVSRRISTAASAAYNLWIGGGSVWIADDRGAEMIRVSPGKNRVVARIPVGDGPADMAFAAESAWVINHRDRVLTRIALGTNRSQALGEVAGTDAATERMVLARGSLWITGRGTDLLQVDPSTGAVVKSVEIGASGIDVAADGGDLWVPTRSAAVDPTGFPTMNALVRVSASTGAVTVVARPRSRVDVHGFVASRGAAWIADNRKGRLYRIASGR